MQNQQKLDIIRVLSDMIADTLADRVESMSLKITPKMVEVAKPGSFDLVTVPEGSILSLTFYKYTQQDSDTDRLNKIRNILNDEDELDDRNSREIAF